MTSADDCVRCVEHLHDAFLRRDDVMAWEHEHVASCSRCASVRDDLAELSTGIAPLALAVSASDSLLTVTRRRARLELAAARELTAEEEEAGARGNLLPQGFGRECLRLLAAALAALPVVLLWNGLVLVGASRLLDGVLPDPVLGALGGAYFASVAGWLAFLYGSIPIVAHRRARLHEETTS